MSRAPLVLDELVDRVFSRPLARIVVAAAAPTPITPNQISCLGIAAGLVAGLGMALLQPWIAAGGLAAFLVLDCSDGQLARRRGGGGNYGRAFDGFGDGIVWMLVHVGLTVGLARALPVWWQGALLGVGAGLSMVWCSGLLDRHKRRYGDSQDDIAAIEAEMAEATGFKRWALGNFRTYALQLQRRAVGIPDLEAYREATRLPTALFLVNGPSTHYGALTVLCALGHPEWYALAAITYGNLMALGTYWLQRRRERGLVEAR